MTEEATSLTWTSLSSLGYPSGINTPCLILFQHRSQNTDSSTKSVFPPGKSTRLLLLRLFGSPKLFSKWKNYFLSLSLYLDWKQGSTLLLEILHLFLEGLWVEGHFWVKFRSLVACLYLLLMKFEYACIGLKGKFDGGCICCPRQFVGLLYGWENVISLV